PDPDGQLAVGLRLLDQADDRRAAVGIEHHAVHPHLDRSRRRGGGVESSDTDQHEEAPAHDTLIVPQAAIHGGGARCRALPRLAVSRFMSLPWRSSLRTAPRRAAALRRLVGDLWTHWDEAFVLDTAASLLRVLPGGIFSLDGLERYVRSVLTQAGRTNDFRRLRRRLLVPATALDSGAIRVFGARLDERTPISRAVAASAAVPILFEPVAVDGVHYVDATVAKTAHARLAVERGAGLVVVVNPMRPLLRDRQPPPPLA